MNLVCNCVGLLLLHVALPSPSEQLPLLLGRFDPGYWCARGLALLTIECPCASNHRHFRKI